MSAENAEHSRQPTIPPLPVATDATAVVVESVAFEGPKTPDRGYTIRASYLKKPNDGDALIEVMKDGQVIRRFMFPAYKIYNLQAHFRDIVDGEIQNSAKGYEMAAWNGISGAVFLLPRTRQDNDDRTTTTGQRRQDNDDDDYMKQARYIAQANEYVTDDYQMFSGQSSAVERHYHKYTGKSDRTWLVADQENAADDIYVTNNPQNTTSKDQGFEGFGGATLAMPLVTGETFALHGGWHSNAQALFDDTGVDVRDTHFTFVVLAKERCSTDDGTWRTVFRDIVYRDAKPVLGGFDRYKKLIENHPDARFYYSSSRGGSSSGPCHQEKKSKD